MHTEIIYSEMKVHKNTVTVYKNNNTLTMISVTFNMKEELCENTLTSQIKPDTLYNKKATQHNNTKPN